MAFLPSVAAAAAGVSVVVAMSGTRKPGGAPLSLKLVRKVHDEGSPGPRQVRIPLNPRLLPRPRYMQSWFCQTLLDRISSSPFFSIASAAPLPVFKRLSHRPHLHRYEHNPGNMRVRCVWIPFAFVKHVRKKEEREGREGKKRARKYMCFFAHVSNVELPSLVHRRV